MLVDVPSFRNLSYIPKQRLLPGLPPYLLQNLAVGGLHTHLELEKARRCTPEQFNKFVVKKVGGDFKMKVCIAAPFNQVAEYFPGESRVAVEGPVHKLNLLYAHSNKPFQVLLNPPDREKPYPLHGGGKAVGTGKGTAPGSFVVHYSIFKAGVFIIRKGNAGEVAQKVPGPVLYDALL